MGGSAADVARLLQHPGMGPAANRRCATTRSVPIVAGVLL
jgi:hypothetical protein